MTLLLIVFFNLFNVTAPNVTFTNIREAKGNLYIGVYNTEAAFLEEEKACFKKIVPVRTAGSISLDLSGLQPGAYAISCFHDVNGNGKLDTNFMGIPSEPYGFSNNARPKFRAPKWEEAKFEWTSEGQRVSIKLEKW